MLVLENYIINIIEMRGWGDDFHRVEHGLILGCFELCLLLLIAIVPKDKILMSSTELPKNLEIVRSVINLKVGKQFGNSVKLGVQLNRVCTNK